MHVHVQLAGAPAVGEKEVKGKLGLEGTHCWGVELPVGQKVPAGQALEVPEMAPWLQKKPAGQGVGAAEPAGQKVPAGHKFVGLEEPAGQELPGGHMARQETSAEELP